jgi:hypothetical protein
MRNLRYISHINGILCNRINDFSNRALTFRYSAAWTAGLSFETCFTRKVRYCCSISDWATLYAQGSTDEFPELV